MKKWRFLGLVCVLLSVMSVRTGWAEEIKIGISAAMSGPASALGQGMRTGIQAHLRDVNAEGGVKGRPVRLVTWDDAYHPDSAEEGVHQLIDVENVLAVVGNVGTPTAKKTVPIANEKKTLLFGAFTGAGLLRKAPPDRYVINFRASYAEETADMVDGLLSLDILPEEIAFFTQDDSYGNAGYEGAIRRLEEKGYMEARSLSHGRYMRNTLNVTDAVVKLLNAPTPPRAIIAVGAYRPCAKFIRIIKRAFPNIIIVNISFVGSEALAETLGADGDGVLVTQVVPHFASKLPVTKEYLSALDRHFPDYAPDFVSLEGFLVAKLFVEGLKHTVEIPTRESIIDGLESLRNLDIGMEQPISFSPTEHQASHKVWLTRIEGGKLKPTTWKEVRARLFR